RGVGGAEVSAGRVVIALHIKRVGRADGQTEAGQSLAVFDPDARFGAGGLRAHVGDVERSDVAVAGGRANVLIGRAPAPEFADVHFGGLHGFAFALVVEGDVGLEEVRPLGVGHGGGKIVKQTAFDRHRRIGNDDDHVRLVIKPLL